MLPNFCCFVLVDKPDCRLCASLTLPGSQLFFSYQIGLGHSGPTWLCLTEATSSVGIHNPCCLTQTFLSFIIQFKKTTHIFLYKPDVSECHSLEQKDQAQRKVFLGLGTVVFFGLIPHPSLTYPSHRAGKVKGEEISLELGVLVWGTMVGCTTNYPYDMHSKRQKETRWLGMLRFQRCLPSLSPPPPSKLFCTMHGSATSALHRRARLRVCTALVKRWCSSIPRSLFLVIM